MRPSILHRSILTLLLAVAALTNLTAATVNYSGETTAQSPHFNRPTDTGTALSSAFDAAFDFYKVTVDTTGSYAFSLRTTESDTSLFDTFLILYSPTFNRDSPLANFIIANDNTNDSNPALGSSFSSNLTAGTNYFLVITGLTGISSFGDYGTYAGSISGPGTPTISTVPEPSSILLVALAALAGLVSQMGKKRQAARRN